MKTPLVSVIVPTKNSARTLEVCLQSIADQTYKNIEIIVVDNFSTDSTQEITKKFTKHYYQKGPERSAQVNYGVTKAKGEYVYKIDSDFVLEPTVVEECIAKVNEGFDAVVVHNSPDVRISWVARIRKFEVDMYKYNLDHSSARFIKKSVYEKLGGFDSSVTAGEDYDFQNKLNRAGIETGFVNAEALHLGEPKSMWKHLMKYYMYGADFVNYKQVATKEETGTQLGFFRRVYRQNWRKFVRHPFQGIRFALYHTAKYAFGGAGLYGAKFQQSKAHRVMFGSARRRTVTVFSIAAITFGMLTWFYMGQALTSCNNVIIGGGPGDGTAGLTWLSWLDKSSPVPGFTHMTNAPFGENLRQPFQITSIFTIPTMWVLAQLTSAICSWNLMVFIGYMTSALVMFAFIRWLTRSTWVAFFAGFAVSYVPFHQMNALGHLSYMFNAVFVLFIWSFVAFWRSPTWKRAALMGLATAFCFYIDGYFILLTILLAAGLLAAAFIADTLIWKRDAAYILARIKGLLIYLVTLVIFLLPIVAVQFKYASHISATLSSSRGNIGAEAQTYSARPYEYLLPADNTPFLPSSYELWRQRILHGSNFSESTLYVGFSVLALTALAWVWYVRKPKDAPVLRGLSTPFLLTVFSFGAFVTFMFSLAPKAHLFGHNIPMPSWFIIHVTAMWRVFGRLFVVVDTCLVILAAIGLYLIIRKMPRGKQAFITLLVVLFAFIEFMTQSRAAVWSYRTIPDVYPWLSKQSNVKIIAEYPLGEPPSQSISDYLTYQQISNKAIFNTSDSASTERAMHLSMGGLADAQTLPILRTLGIDVVLSHRMPAPAGIGLTQLRYDKSHYNDDNVWTYKIEPGTKATYALMAQDGFHAPIIGKDSLSRIGMGSHGILGFKRLISGSDPTTVHVSFDAAATDKPQLVTVAQEGIVRWQGTITKNTHLQFDADPRIALDIIPYNTTADEPIQIYNLRATVKGE
jgi:glycosyltransferase involved in cell wall biosynthesis